RGIGHPIPGTAPVSPGNPRSVRPADWRRDDPHPEGEWSGSALGVRRGAGRHPGGLLDAGDGHPAASPRAEGAGGLLVRILITNDDGVHAEGLLALKRAIDPL